MKEPISYKWSLGLWASIVTLLGASAAPVPVYFGTGGSETKGIYRASFDADTGKLSGATLAAQLGSPGFLAWGPDGSRLYAVGNLPAGPGVVGYKAQADGSLSLINSSTIGDGGAAHLAVHPSGRFLLTAQYGGGSVALFPLDEAGRLGSAEIIRHESASGIVPIRQDKPHPHWCGFSPDAAFALVPDLGMDAIIVYRVTLSDASPHIHFHGKIPSDPGAGPRHMRFSVDGKWIYLLNELALTVNTYAWSPVEGTAKLISSVPALATEVKDKEVANSAAEVLVHPSGRFVYSSNRGHDSVTVYQATPGTGDLKVVEVEPVRGALPRNINLDPSGRWLLAGGADSNTVSVFRVDESSGELRFQPKAVINVPGPICILFGR